MFELNGKYGTAVVMIDDVEPECVSHIIRMLNHPSFTNKVAIMSDCHEGKGSVVGFTMPMGDSIIASTIGVDISCGMLSAKISDTTFDGKNFDGSKIMGRDWVDKYIRSFIPFGKEVQISSVYKAMERQFPWKDATELNRQFVMAYERRTGNKMPHTPYSYYWFEDKCKQIGMDISRAELSIGTLGGGK